MITFRTIAALLDNTDSLTTNSLFKPFLSKVEPAIKMMKVFKDILQSFNEDELMMKKAITESRIQRIANGSGTSVENVKKLCELGKTLRNNGMKSLMEQVFKMHPEMSKFSPSFMNLFEKKVKK